MRSVAIVLNGAESDAGINRPLVENNSLSKGRRHRRPWQTVRRALMPLSKLNSNQAHSNPTSSSVICRSKTCSYVTDRFDVSCDNAGGFGDGVLTNASVIGSSSSDPAQGDVLFSSRDARLHIGEFANQRAATNACATPLHRSCFVDSRRFAPLPFRL